MIQYPEYLPQQFKHMNGEELEIVQLLNRKDAKLSHTTPHIVIIATKDDHDTIEGVPYSIEIPKRMHTILKKHNNL